MISIRGGSGLGDAIYLQSVVRYFVSKGEKVEACCDWPDVFAPLGHAVMVSPFRRAPIDRNAHYSLRRGVKGTSQFEDCCIQAGIKGPVDFRLGWASLSPLSVPRDLPLVLVSMPRAPFGRSDGFGQEFLPDCQRIQDAIDQLTGIAFIVQIGKGEPGFRLKGIDLDLAGKTSVPELLDLANLAAGFLGFCSYIVPLAEAMMKPALLIWSRRGLKSPHEVIRQMTPQKILHRSSSRAVIDDCSDRELMDAADAFCEQVRSPVPV